MNESGSDSRAPQSSTTQTGSEMDFGAVPLRSATSVTVPGRAEGIGSPAGSPRHYLNDRFNSRLSHPVGTSKWSIRWEAELNPIFPFSYVLQAADRVVLAGPAYSQLFTLSGSSLALAKHGPGDIVLDGKDASLLQVDPFGRLEVRALTDGALRFVVPISGSDELQRAFFAKIGHRIVVASFERQINPHATQPPNASTLEVLDMGQPLKIESEMLASSKQEKLHYYEAPRIVAALHGDTLVAAVRGHILVTHLGLEVRGNYTGAFKPGALSLDETGRIYMLVNVNDRLAVWAVTPEGERLFTFEFPPERAVTPMPPAIDFDHRIFLHTADSVIAISPVGKLLWERSPGGPIAGIALATDDQTLVSAGSTLVALNSKGDSRIIQDFKGDILKTPPAMSANGELLVASSKKLYCLTNSPR